VKFQTEHFHHLQFPFIAAGNNVYENDVYHDEDYGEYGEEEEDLGYYEDGVKRTLSDEQVKIFRHSEIHSLLRERQRLREEEEENEEEEEDEEGEAMETPSDTSLVDEGQTLAAKMGSAETDSQKAHATDTETAAQSVEVKPDPIEEAYSGRRMVSYSDD
jgi:hypothetical protein